MNARTLRTGLVIFAVAITTGTVMSAPAGAQIGADSWQLTVETYYRGHVTGSGTDGNNVDWNIDCGIACSATINNACAFDPDFHEVVCERVGASLHAADADGLVFEGWQGCDYVSGTDNRDCDVN